MNEIRVLNVVNIVGCDHLVDCLVFPVLGKRPHANEIAGSDLDGDQFFVCWDSEFLPKQTIGICVL